MGTALARLDHLICEVPDVRQALRLFHDRLGFPVAWPIGRFWPGGLTCGIALGGVNLELLQPLAEPPARARIRMLVFAPPSLEEAEQALFGTEVSVRRFEKVEPDPSLLKLRGFSEAEAATPQHVCTNLNPVNSDLPVDFFLCEYSPFLRGYLAPEHPRLASVPASLAALSYGTPRPHAAEQLLYRLGYESEPSVRFVPAQQTGVVNLAFTGEVPDLGDWEADFTCTAAKA